MEAVMATDGIVLKNPDLNGYAEAVFHSNCGGMTASAKSVWKNDISVCEIMMDSFCINGKHATWEKKISLNQFTTTVGILSSGIASDSICQFVQFCHTGERPNEFTFGNSVISAVKMRSLFSLRSAWFDIECLNDSILFTGKGYGHGVGMCQEGAIAMSSQNKDFIAILKYYFKRVTIVNEKLNTILYRKEGASEM
jgi:stage II sporulation protein D